MDQYSREQLIEICEQSIVPVKKWGNRDTPNVQQKVGVCWALLKSGCSFQIDKTTTETIWLSIETPTFNTFEYGEGNEDVETFYLPTPRRLESRQDRDWY